MADRDHATIEEALSRDERVQYEFEQLNRLLEEIVDVPLSEYSASSDPNWPIPEHHVSRWLITLKGELNLERVAAFRKTMLKCDNVLDARVHDLMNGRLCIRLVTTGGIQMGPIEQALGALRDGRGTVDSTLMEPATLAFPA